MVEPFKHLIGADTVRATARHLKRVWPMFNATGFERQAGQGLEALEFKARAMHLASALEATLPDDFAHAADILEASLGQAGAGDQLADLRTGDAGLAGWVMWPLGEFVVRRGMVSPQRALKVLHATTQRHTAEWALRPFIVQHPQLTFATLQQWTQDPSAHVRRLVSEGSRPRLPWGLQLKSLIADPSPTRPLLLALQDDRSEYVRRSVANHLNDIAKDHPDLVLAWLKEHLPEASPERRALLRHACRSLVKQGDAAVLRAWGLGRPLSGTATLGLTPKRVRIGQELQLNLVLASTSARAQTLLIDYVVHHVKANGSRSPKVFKAWKLELAAHERRELSKRHSLREITTRRYHPGRHGVQLQINGVEQARADFDLS
ncbi:MAG: DNA alkylation repair protein [Rubrivivax sp.]